MSRQSKRENGGGLKKKKSKKETRYIRTKRKYI